MMACAAPMIAKGAIAARFKSGCPEMKPPAASPTNAMPPTPCNACSTLPSIANISPIKARTGASAKIPDVTRDTSAAVDCPLSLKCWYATKAAAAINSDRQCRRTRSNTRRAAGFCAGNGSATVGSTRSILSDPKGQGELAGSARKSSSSAGGLQLHSRRHTAVPGAHHRRARRRRRPNSQYAMTLTAMSAAASTHWTCHVSPGG
jgi:hypothetical protein